MENITQIQPFESMLPWNPVPPNLRRRQAQKKKPAADSGRNFSALSELVDDTHLSLVAKESPFRLCVYRKNDEILMDIVTLD
ncbi:MAG: hypothetical protein WC836_11040, partial [Desulfobacula sp.]